MVLPALAAAAVSIENCVITEFALLGISDARTAGNTKLFVRNTMVSHNGSTGIALTATAPNTTMVNNLFGAAADMGNNAIMTRSVFFGSSTGVAANAGGAVNVDSSSITGNGAQVSGIIRLSNSDVFFRLQRAGRVLWKQQTARKRDVGTDVAAAGGA